MRKLLKILIILLHTLITGVIFIVAIIPAIILGFINVRLIRVESWLRRKRLSLNPYWAPPFKIGEAICYFIQIPIWMVGYILKPLIGFPKYLLSLIPYKY